MHVSLRKMGNSSGILIPKPMLAQLGLSTGDDLDLSLENGSFKLTPIAGGVRVGWAEAAAAIAAAATPETLAEDLEWTGFGNEGDDELTW